MCAKKVAKPIYLGTGACVARFAFPRSIHFACFFALCCRIGEAKNPGPQSTTELQIGCFNPSGVQGKAGTINLLPRKAANIWAISETHLTQAGASKFNRELKFHCKHFHTQLGSPVPHRSAAVSSIGGKNLGTGFITDCATRPMSATWEKQTWEQCRFHISCFQVGHRWIQGAVIYGHSFQSNTTATRLDTESICQIVSERLIAQSSGLRFIAGDFNQGHGELESMRRWEQMGWVNLQIWARDHLGIPIRPTSKGSTPIDHLYLSPELAVYLRDIQVDDTYFADHAILAATLEFPEAPPLLPRWYQPKPLDWKAIGTLDEVPYHNETSLTPTRQMQKLFQHFEGQIQKKTRAMGTPLPPALGELAIEVSWIPECSRPPKIGRHCDPM